MTILNAGERYILSLYDRGLQVRRLRFPVGTLKRLWIAERRNAKLGEYEYIDGRVAYRLVRRGYLVMIAASQFNGCLYKRTELGQAALTQRGQ